MFDNLETKHLSGLYSVRVGNKLCVYYQTPELDPPKFGVTKPTNTKLKTSNLGIVLKSDSECLQNHSNQIERARNLTRTQKRKRETEDEVDLILFMAQIATDNEYMNIVSAANIPFYVGW